MKAKLLDRRRFVVFSRSGRAIVVVMDLFKILGKDTRRHPDGFRFSWIAFDAEKPERRVLFDSHPPKGPHVHIDGDKVGVSFEWTTLEEAKAKFFRTATRHFGLDKEALQ